MSVSPYKMIAAGRCTLRIHSLIITRFLHLSKLSQKKNYNYDLDSLIEWKKETVRIFGPVRKATKTGKLKKTKKGLDPQVEENLQTLSAISASRENYWDNLNSAVAAGNMCRKLEKMTISNETILPCFPSADFIPVWEQADDEESVKGIENLECSIKAKFCDIPDDVLVSAMILHNAEPVLKQRITFDDNDESSKETLYYDSSSDVAIPKISPIPAATSVTPTKKFMSTNSVNKTVTSAINKNVKKAVINHSNETVKIMSSENVVPVSNVSVIHNAEPLSTKSMNIKNTKVTKKKSSSQNREDISSTIISGAKTEDNLGQELTGTEIFIPKIKPIPQGTISYGSSNSSPLPIEISSVPTLKSSGSNALHNLPFEPPESFDIISKIPLFPRESNDWQRGLDSRLLHDYKMDVEHMFLRVPPSVKTILNKTMPDLNRFFLNRWREGLINELGEDGFKKHQDATIRKGVNLHANVMMCLSGKPASELQIMPENEGHWCSLQSSLAAISGVRALEMEISHSVLLYRGVFDCLAQYKDMLCMIDWKTSKKPRPLLKNTYDDPVQIAAYIGALNASDDYIQKDILNLLPIAISQYGQISNGIIVVAYPDGSPAHIHIMNRATCEEHWQNWTERLYNYYQLTYTEKMAANADKINAKNVMSSLGATR